MLNKMVKKEAIGIISVFLFILLITTNAVASKIVTKSGPTKVQIYKISGDFSQVAYDGNNSEMYKTLTARDWEVQCDSFQKSLGEIRKEIRTMAPAKYLAAKKHNLPPTSNNIEGAVKSFSQSITKSNSNIRSSIDTANDEEIYTKSLTEKVNSKFTADDNMIEQHFGYAIGKKTINGKNVYVIAFRGTADTYSWIFTDFIAFPIEFLKTNTQVHIGFEWNRQACMKQNFLKDFIRAIQADASDPIIIITGHSMGAAIAVLETAYFIEKKLQKLVIYS